MKSINGNDSIFWAIVYKDGRQILLERNLCGRLEIFATNSAAEKVLSKYACPKLFDVVPVKAIKTKAREVKP